MVSNVKNDDEDSVIAIILWVECDKHREGSEGLPTNPILLFLLFHFVGTHTHSRDEPNDCSRWE